jgi:hypothetical protein
VVSIEVPTSLLANPKARAERALRTAKVVLAAATG